jgi:hypothetical protein
MRWGNTALSKLSTRNTRQPSGVIVMRSPAGCGLVILMRALLETSSCVAKASTNPDYHGKRNEPMLEKTLVMRRLAASSVSAPGRPRCPLGTTRSPEGSSASPDAMGGSLA